MLCPTDRSIRHDRIKGHVTSGNRTEYRITGVEHAHVVDEVFGPCFIRQARLTKGSGMHSLRTNRQTGPYYKQKGFHRSIRFIGLYYSHCERGKPSHGRPCTSQARYISLLTTNWKPMSRCICRRVGRSRKRFNAFLFVITEWSNKASTYDRTFPLYCPSITVYTEGRTEAVSRNTTNGGKAKHQVQCYDFFHKSTR